MTNANFISHQFSNLCLYLCGMGINLKLHPVPGFRCGQSRLSLSTFVYSLSWMQYFFAEAENAGKTRDLQTQSGMERQPATDASRTSYSYAFTRLSADATSTQAAVAATCESSLPAHTSAGRTDVAGSGNSNTNKGGFVCRICLGPPLQCPVVTRCGHLFCWKCLDAWAVQRGQRTVLCPYCKIAVDVDQDATPILGVGDGGWAASASSSSSRPNAPTRPQEHNGVDARPNSAAAPPPRPQRRPEAHVPPPATERDWQRHLVLAIACGLMPVLGFARGKRDGIFFVISACLFLYAFYLWFRDYTDRNAQRQQHQDNDEEARASRFRAAVAAEVEAERQRRRAVDEDERQRRRVRVRQIPGLEGLFLRTVDAIHVNVDDDESVRSVVVCAAALLVCLFGFIMSR
jgi:E3 ubiquitin-protein ligase RNF5